MKKRLLSLTLLLILTLVNAASVFANSSGSTDYMDKPSSSGYTTKQYNVEFTVGEDMKIHVKEEIDVYFQMRSRGILRYMPQRPEVVYTKDGEVIKREFPVKISNINTHGEPTKVYTEDGNTVIRLGDPDRRVSGEKYYTIEYDYQIYGDFLQDANMFYMDFIPLMWDAPVYNSTFTLNMPKSFEKNNLSIISSQEDRGDMFNINFVDDKTVVATLKNGEVLNRSDAATVKIELDDTYFTQAIRLSEQENILRVVLVVLLALAFVIYKLCGKSQRPIPVIEYLPPDDFTPAQLGYLIDLNSDNRDVLSMIIYWAHKGYLTIEEKTEDDIWLHKLKSLPTTAEDYETHLFNALFPGGKMDAQISSLKNNFATQLQHARNMLQTNVNSKITTEYKDNPKKLFRVFSFLMIFAPLAATLFYNFTTTVFSLPLAIAGVVVTLIYGVIFYLVNRISYYGSKASYIIGFLISAFIGVVYSFICREINFISFTVILQAQLFSIIGAIFFANTHRFSPKYIHLLGRIIGFRNFLEEAEKDKLNELVEQYPHYFYDILPYAYALNVSDKWAKNFEQLAVEPPDWYIGTGWTNFNTYYMMRTLNRSMHTMNGALTSVKIESSNLSSSGSGRLGGGGFSGGGSFGGFSGGGFGGGGGGRW